MERVSYYYFFLEQWQRPEETPHLRAEPTLFSELHFLFKADEDRGGFPTEETWERLVIWKAEEEDGCCLLSQTPVKEEINELAADEYEKLIVVEESFLSRTLLFGTTK